MYTDKMLYTDKMQKSHEKYHLTRRDFELIATVIARLPVKTMRNKVCEEFAITFSTLHRDFNGARFRKACGL